MCKNIIKKNLQKPSQNYFSMDLEEVYLVAKKFIVNLRLMKNECLTDSKIAIF